MKNLYILTALLLIAITTKAQNPAIHTSNNGGMITKRFYNGTSNSRLANHKSTPNNISEPSANKDSTVSFGLHPNPVQNILTITPKQITDGDYTYYITDNNGVRVVQGKLNNGTAQVSVEYLPVATYTLHVTKGNEAISSYTFVKN